MPDKPNYWTDLVSYDRAIALLSTDAAGTNARAVIERCSNTNLSSEQHGAWLCNEGHAYCAYRSILAHRAQVARALPAAA